MNRGREDGREDSLKGRDQRSVLLRGRERKRERTRDEHRSSIRYIMWYIIANFSHRLTRLDILSALPLFLSLSFSLYLFPSLPVLFFLYSRDSPFQNAYTIQPHGSRCYCCRCCRHCCPSCRYCATVTAATNTSIVCK